MEQKIQYTNTLKVLKERNSLIQSLCSQIKEDFPVLAQVSLNVELVKLICDKIEYTCKTKHLKKVNKKEFFYLIYENLYDNATLTNNKKYIDSIIEYLHENNLIVTISTVLRAVSKVANYFLTKKVN